MSADDQIHQSNPEKLPDTEFMPGSLCDLVPGNEGRLLDPRRTPIRVVEIEEPTGHFIVEITDFEDQGAHWAMPFEDVSRFQFHHQCTKAGPADEKRYSDIIKRLDQPLHIPCSAERRRETTAKIAHLRHEVGDWLDVHSSFLRSGQTLVFSSRDGIPTLYGDCHSLMNSRNLRTMDSAFAKQFASNPYSGELVKGHRIVLAELGLVEYHGKIIRDPTIFDGEWSRARRTEHILVRLAFLRELFSRTGNNRLTVYRGIAVEGSLEPLRNTTFVSATFNLQVATSIFSGASNTRDGALFRQHVRTDRIFMTYLETEELNRQFREADAIVLCTDTGTFF